VIRATFGVTSASSLTLSALYPNVCKVVDIIVLFKKRTFPKKTQQQFRNRKQKCSDFNQLRTTKKMIVSLCVFQSLFCLKVQQVFTLLVDVSFYFGMIPDGS